MLSKKYIMGMIILDKWVIIVLILVIGFVVYNNKKEVGYRQMDPAEAKAQLEQDKNIILLDVRTQEEYNEKHIEGSKLIPLNILEDKVEEEIPNKEQKIIIYCRSGNRSNTALNTLLKMGYKNVYDLGGINSWPYGTK